MGAHTPDGYGHVEDAENPLANARLIAAAPRMLEALKLNLVEQERMSLALGGAVKTDTPGMAMIRAILRDVEGESNG